MGEEYVRDEWKAAAIMSLVLRILGTGIGLLVALLLLAESGRDNWPFTVGLVLVAGGALSVSALRRGDARCIEPAGLPTILVVARRGLSTTRRDDDISAGRCPPTFWRIWETLLIPMLAFSGVVHATVREFSPTIGFLLLWVVVQTPLTWVLGRFRSRIHGLVPAPIRLGRSRPRGGWGASDGPKVLPET